MKVKNYILTGTPGSGKTSLIRNLEYIGYPVIEEAATDIITLKQLLNDNSPWEKPSFINEVLSLQMNRIKHVISNDRKIIFHDRSTICTYALSKYLGYDTSKNLLNIINNCIKEEIFQKRVFFISNLGFIVNNEARKITYKEAMKFERIHLDSYKEFGFECFVIQKDDIFKRTEIILNNL